MGAQMVREVASKSSDFAGEGILPGGRRRLALRRSANARGFGLVTPRPKRGALVG
jgi:hypothetical protein